MGWFDYEIMLAGQRRTFELGPHEYNTEKPQGVVVVLPKKEIVTDLGAPYGGEWQWWSDSGDDIDHMMSRQVTLPAGSATLTFQARWNIEDCGPDPCDYAYVEVNTGTAWTAIPGSITEPTEGNGIDGVAAAWTEANFDLSAYAGSTIGLRFRYRTDGAVQGQADDLPAGLFVDDILLTANDEVLLEDGAEGDDHGWTLDGFKAIGATETTLYDNYYIASHRQYVSFDKYLRTGPYNIGFLPDRPGWVEHFPYQDGLLIWYWDTVFGDNDVTVHPGQGEILPIDAHPRPIYNLQGLPWRGRIGLYDAPFALDRADTFTLHNNGSPSLIHGQRGESTFDDARLYWYSELPNVGVKVPNAGVRIRVLRQDGTSMRIRIGPS